MVVITLRKRRKNFYPLHVFKGRAVKNVKVLNRRNQFFDSSFGCTVREQLEIERTPVRQISSLDRIDLGIGTIGRVPTSTKSKIDAF